MDNSLEKSLAWINIENSFKKNNISHSYVINCSNDEKGKSFAIKMVQLLFCMEKNSSSQLTSEQVKELIQKNKYIDCLWIEPKSKSRAILSDDIELILSQMNRTAFNNNWKACIIFQAEYMRLEAQNKLLKMLEEPPESSIIILVTSNINALLPTVTSRCKTVNYNIEEEKDEIEIVDLLKMLPPKNGIEAELIANKFLSYSSEENISSYINLNSDLQEIDFSSKDLYEAHIESLRRNYQQKLILNLLNWFRDLLLISNNIKEGIYYSSFIDCLEKQSNEINKFYILKVISQLENFSKRINSTLIDVHVVDDIFRKMIVL